MGRTGRSVLLNERGRHQAEYGTASAVELLEEIGSRVAFDWTSLTAVPKTVNDGEVADLDLPYLYINTDAKSLKCVLSRSWFERLWIWQEIRLGKTSSLLVCSNKTILWSTF